MKKNLLFIISGALLFTACSSSDNLEGSVTIYDDEYTDLPAYSEWGYNTFGAYYDRNVFISDNATPAKVLSKGGVTTFSLQGAHEIYGDMTLKFILKDYSPAKYADLVSLNDSTIDLANSKCKVCMVMGGKEDTVNILNGTLYIKRAQHLYVNKESVEAILSGYFQFQMIKEGTPSTLSHGRFDVGIGYDNFYKL
jgi:hypothetical protein